MYIAMTVPNSENYYNILVTAMLSGSYGFYRATLYWMLKP
jgi:hypothetical protein